MASECILLKGGGGGVSSDELTATKDQVLEGSTYVGADTNDDIGVGTIPIQESKQDASHVIEHSLGDRLTVAFPTGYYKTTNATVVDNLPYVYVPYTTLVEVLGIEASKMLATETIAGVTGTIPIQASKQEPSHIIHSTKGDRLAISFPIGYYGATNATNVDGLPHVYVLYSKLAEVLGIEASKMLTTETIAGVQGSIPVQGAVTPSALNCGGSYTIPAGYHDGKGKVTANSLANQTSATATSAQILKDKTAWVNGSKLTGSLAVTSAINFKATAQSATVIRISWTNPSKGPWEGVFIQMSTSGNPGVSGGTRVYTGRGNSTTAGGSNYVDITGLTPGVTYYFTCTSYCNALGWGTSHNVSAKTNGLLLYNYGVNAYALSIENSTMAAFQTDHILCTPTDRYEQLKVPSINYQNYTKLKVIANIYVSSSWFDIFCVTIHNANKNVILHSLEEIKFVQETTSELAFDISSISTETLSYLNFHVHAETSSYSHDYNSKIKIYKLWLE